MKKIKRQLEYKHLGNQSNKKLNKKVWTHFNLLEWFHAEGVRHLNILFMFMFKFHRLYTTVFLYRDKHF
jgi:hypothetical protein